MFYLLRPDPGPGKEYVEGRITRIQSNTTRPGNIWREVWDRMSKPQRAKAIEAWKEEKPLLDAARKKHGNRPFIPNNEVDEYHKVMAEKRLELCLPAAPAMPLQNGVRRSD